MSVNALSFHLLLERPGESAGPGQIPDPTTAPPSSPGRLEIKNGISYVTTCSKGTPRLMVRPSGNSRKSIVFQPVWQTPSPKLLMLNPDRLPLMLNGKPAAPVSLLVEKDEVSFDPFGRYVAHVVLFHNPHLGPPDDRDIGKLCPLCKVKFIEDTILYRCYRCGKALHIEGDEKLEKDRLECARICSECPACQAPIRTESGYRYTPEFCRR